MLVCTLALTTILHADSKAILVMGDSISTAYGMNKNQGWVSLLAQRLDDSGYDYTVVNASISGALSASGKQNITRHLQTYSPGIVIIELGGNDGLRGHELERIKANLQNMIDDSLASGAAVLLAGMRIPPNYGPRYTDGFTRIYYDLAKENPITMVPFILNGVGGVPGMMQGDGIHPNVKAQSVILDNVWPWLVNKLQ